jgi:hypothetical protein
MYICRTCDLRILEIPSDAKLIAPSRRGRFSALYLFADGKYHDLRKRRDAEPPPIVKQELPEENLPDPQPLASVEEKLPEVEVEQLPEPEVICGARDHVKPTTTISLAFNRLFKS